MSVEFCGLELAHPVINGSGTFDAIAAQRTFGPGLRDAFPFAAYVSKTITLEPRIGNPPPRLWETSGGLINSIGLPNKGLAAYLAEDVPELAELQVPLITNVMGSSAEELWALVAACESCGEIAAIELNVSCPNVKTGLDIGADPLQLEKIVRTLRAATAKPLIVKLTPNTVDVAACALAAEDGGADAVSLINTLRAMALAPARASEAHAPQGRLREDRDADEANHGGGAASGPRPPARGVSRAWLGGGTGGLSGPAVRAVALAQVAAVAGRVKIPVIGMGGVQSGAHARDLIDLGAVLVAVGTESFRDPAAATRIVHELLFTASR